MANKHVRSAATGTGSGDDWTNAYTALPAALSRDNIYYIGVGSYAGYIFDDAEDGTKVIQIKKATIADHGSATGWDDAYAAQADFNGTFRFDRDYYTIAGAYRNEDDWKSVSAYGIKCSGIRASTSDSTVGHHIIVQDVSLLRSYSLTYSAGLPERVYCGGFTETITNWTISRCMMANSVGTIVQWAGVSDMVLEDCYLGASWGKEAIRGQGSCSNVTIRNNTFVDSTQLDPDDPTSGITAEIGLWDYSVAQSGVRIYGNTFTNQFSGGRNSCVVVGGNGTSWVGSGSNGTLCYNNTFAGIADSSVFTMILLNGDSTEAKNNLFYDCATSNVSADVVATNVVAALDPFVDFAALDLNITDSGEAYEAGTNLGAGGWTPDRNGTARGVDGTWSVGAMEFNGSSSTINAATFNFTTLTIG